MKNRYSARDHARQAGGSRPVYGNRRSLSNEFADALGPGVAPAPYCGAAAPAAPWRRDGV